MLSRPRVSVSSSPPLHVLNCVPSILHLLSGYPKSLARLEFSRNFARSSHQFPSYKMLELAAMSQCSSQPCSDRAYFSRDTLASSGPDLDIMNTLYPFSWPRASFTFLKLGADRCRGSPPKVNITHKVDEVLAVSERNGMPETALKCYGC